MDISLGNVRGEPLTAESDEIHELKIGGQCKYVAYRVEELQGQVLVRVFRAVNWSHEEVLPGSVDEANFVAAGTIQKVETATVNRFSLVCLGSGTCRRKFGRYSPKTEQEKQELLTGMEQKLLELIG